MLATPMLTGQAGAQAGGCDWTEEAFKHSKGLSAMPHLE